MRWRFLLAVTLITMTGAAHAAELSGTYVAKGDTLAVLLQVIQAADGSIVGHYAQVVLQSDGQLDRMDASVTGVSDGRTVVLTLRPAELLAGSVTASGTLDGGVLQLIGGGFGSNLQLSLVRSDGADFQEKANALSVEAGQIATAKRSAEEKEQQARELEEEAKRLAKAEADQLTGMANLEKRMIDFPSHVHFDNFSSTEARYRSITDWMKRQFAREQAILGENGSYTRGQIAYAIRQAQFEADEAHSVLQSNEQQFEVMTAPLLDELARLSAGCRPDQATSAAEKSACASFSDHSRDFQALIGKVRTAYSDVENVWEQQKSEQDRIVEASSNAP